MAKDTINQECLFYNTCKDTCKEIDVIINSKYYKFSMINLCIRKFEAEYADAPYSMDDIYELCVCFTEEIKNLSSKQYTKNNTEKECKNILGNITKTPILNKCITQLNRNMK